jgi:alkanesulfonate monooxygenase SsuD/methylene tetrahydromethanopterin reductase-like flavin-dependent oxidoreductase (luciferase family)
MNCYDIRKRRKMKVSVVLPAASSERLADVAKAAEKFGFYRAWTTESPGRDAILRSSYVLASSSTLRSGTGISFAFTRSPLAVAGAAADAFALSGGRFSLGLGAGTRGQRRWYMQEFDHPADRMADYVRTIKAVLRSSGRAEYSGKFYELGVPRIELPTSVPPLTELKIYGGGLHPRMLTAVAESCDGFVLHPLAGSTKYLDDVVLPIIEGASSERDGRPELIIWCPLSVDADSDVARQRAAEQLAFYFSTPSYLDVATQLGFGTVASELVRRYNDKASPTTFREISEIIPDDMLSYFIVWGDPEQVRSRLRARIAELETRGVAELSIQLSAPGSGGQETIDAIEDLGPLLRDQAT